MNPGAITPFQVEQVDYALALPDLRRVRDEVFIDEQGVPAELEHDEARDPLCVHVLARFDDGTPIGTGRLTPDCHIGRMAVRKPWRGRGVGDALLRALLDAAWLQGADSVHLNAQVDAIGFYARHGFAVTGERFIEAGIEHQAMVRSLDGPRAIRTRPMAIAATRRIIAGARRGLWIRSDALDPGLFDAAEVVDALRSFATHRREAEVRILLHDAAAAQRARSPLLALAQRLPSVFAVREVSDPVDRNSPAAFTLNDRGGWYYRALGHRLEGDASLGAPGRGRQLQADFEPVWGRARVASELRALEL